jgi:hypothetical protein
MCRRLHGYFLKEKTTIKIAATLWILLAKHIKALINIAL